MSDPSEFTDPLAHWSALNSGDPFERVPFGLLLTRPDRKIVYANALVCEWLDYSAEELRLQRSFQDLLTVGGKIYYETHHNGLESLQGRTRELSYTLLTRDRSRIDVLVNTQRTYDSEERHLYTEIFLFRFSERQKYEQELLRAKKIAEEAARAKTQFISNVSHEVRTPLHTIVGMTDLLRFTPLGPEQRDMLETLRFSTDNLLQLINDVLTFSKLERGAQRLHPTDWDLRLSLQSLVKTFLPRLDADRVELQLEVDPEVPEMIRGDKVKILQILNNLVGNAVKFTHDGFIHIDIRHHTTPHDTAFDFYLECSVSDSGIGISPDQQQTIFNAFQQADEAIAATYGGTGLGLSIARDLVALHQQELRLDSTPGQGTTFSFRLPLHIGQAAEPEQTVPAEDPVDWSAHRILLVEDNESSVFVVSRYFRRWKLHFDHAANGREALRMVQEQPYDLILMDRQMPQMSGLQATEEIRRLPDERFRKIPILVLSAEINDEVRHRMNQAGANDYILKPFRPHAFRQKLLQYLTSAAPTAESPDLEGLIDYLEGDRDEAAEYLDLLLPNWQTLRNQMAAHLEQGDEVAYGQIVHRMLPTLRLLKLDRFRERLQTVRAAGLSDSDGLTEEFDEVLRWLATERAGLE